MIPRLAFWTVAMAYAVFLIVSRGSMNVTLSVGSSAILMGAASGLILGAMFSRRAVRRSTRGSH